MSLHDAKIRQRVRKVFDEIAGFVQTALEEAMRRGGDQALGERARRGRIYGGAPPPLQNVQRPKRPTTARPEGSGPCQSALELERRPDPEDERQTMKKRGVLFDPGHGRTSKEWASVAPESKDSSLKLATDAREFAESL
jgi:hypothetical protein